MEHNSQPDASDWMRLLYDECGPEEAVRLQQQLSTSPELRTQFAAWQRTMSRLDHWTVDSAGMPPMPSRQLVAETVGRWRSVLTAATCLACVLLAFLAGQSISASAQPDITKLKSDLKRELSTELQTRLVGLLQSEVEPVVKAQLASMKPDQSSLLPLIETESTRIAAAAVASWAKQDSAHRQRLQQILSGVLDNQLSLRTDLENLAIEAEAQILRTRRELVGLSMMPNPPATDGALTNPPGQPQNNL